MLKLSARNQFKGKIFKVIKGKTTSHVILNLNGLPVMAAIPNEEAEELQLLEGKAAIALIKASDIIIGVEE
ncbi:TOBE domain-containing protein [Zymomonas mobilis]|uniref:TOBE domain protein n=1 Tax=Zymomonas mobilis subsp. pomaceae (strain ATCC 29192 / DSM 22645 / JCM 10191 / CCUG 17912 / NBRC 13757 / NCIMB 11200 / NRRL B-4491 / Barker I) TaxID=579138 RepID=F8EUN8_ZYMMT|nr:TOBE domain-containing protein [Zymomonas mobilis]AEI38184.1 TOBE domain protein [Zymomonas mobilis subsp. pomaceae ATCC 29192]MDX5947874.1 TOBE domain-containing protein [Zymomonas mobilis subsp. pomaceae]GEB89963.1 hypothetical protein ZMO02_16000 [Zymomonas mobilis subsp. pomaceae]